MSRRKVADGQRPLPFKTGLPKKMRRARAVRPAKTWRVADGQIARICPICGCHRDRRCVVKNKDGADGACVPAGLYGRRYCSACRQPELFNG